MKNVFVPGDFYDDGSCDEIIELKYYQDDNNLPSKETVKGDYSLFLERRFLTLDNFVFEGYIEEVFETEEEAWAWLDKKNGLEG